MFLVRCIAPHFFQVIKFSGLRVHYMHYHIHIINQHPLQILQALMMIRPLITIFIHLVFYIISDCPYLCSVTSFTYNKKISYRFINFLRSREIIFSPFLSWIAAMMVLMIFELLVNRDALFLRLVRDANCSK